ncbi:hypothetical protein LguiA_007640 [Lonicera macranthoides]
MSGKSNYATLWLALSGSARSNKVLNAGNICSQTMHRAYDAVFINKRYYEFELGLAICLSRHSRFRKSGFDSVAASGVGFLRYFQLEQLPNFLLAFPILSLAVCSIIYYAKLQREVFLSLGFRASPVDKKSAAMFFSVAAESRSKSEFGLEKETTKICEVNLQSSHTSFDHLAFGLALSSLVSLTNSLLIEKLPELPHILVELEEQKCFLFASGVETKEIE